MQFNLRLAEKSDLAFLEMLEESAFEKFQRSNRRNLTHSIESSFQQCWICESKNGKVEAGGSIILFVYKHTLRIYSVAVHPDFRHQGMGAFLIKEVLGKAREMRKRSVVLEASATNDTLLKWYKSLGFREVRHIKDYYTAGEDCIKMELLIDYGETIGIKNLIVMNHPRSHSFTNINAEIISVKEYISKSVYHSDSNLRIFNLCSSYHYQSYGYYVSLLASARGQRVIPSVATIRDFSSTNIIRSISTEMSDLLNSSFKHINVDRFTINIYFGHSPIRGFKKLAMRLYKLFESPLLSVQFIKIDNNWIIRKIQNLNPGKISEDEFLYVNHFARIYFDKKRFNKARLPSYIYDLAILVNPAEENSPSCAKALEKFHQAANRQGIYLEFIRKNDFDRINEFDALFIRETTTVNNHTYELSRLAYAEGLVVIDDPWSILRCSNKIYQYELFRQNKIQTPNSFILSKNYYRQSDCDTFFYPLVLKQPDSAFSLGVIKVNNAEDAHLSILKLFKKSDMIICQEYKYSEFDWRIGVLDNRALYACKYYMSDHHWQIYNWQGAKGEEAGMSETLSVEEVPATVLKTALKAASLIGDGLYGVDLKEVNGEVLVIEVNDNPSIDAGVEDLFLGDRLYDKIIESFLIRIEQQKNIIRYLSD
ncbi:MAG: GNAT family N-acetyltransferase [Bacteroidales bacterium]|nr:GNAT family N-acetyltransferase [Bacteroidales bacterium]